MQEDVKPNVLKEPVENLKNVGNHPENYIKCV